MSVSLAFGFRCTQVVESNSYFMSEPDPRDLISSCMSDRMVSLTNKKVYSGA